MRIILEHIRAREIPHDLIEFMQDGKLLSFIGLRMWYNKRC